MSKRVLLVHNAYLDPGGEEAGVKALREGLSRAGWETALFGRDNRELLEMGPLDRAAAGAETLFSLSSHRALLREIDRFHPDIIHVHNIFPLLSPSVYFAAGRRRVPVVQTLHNYRFLCVNGLLLRDGKPCERCLGGNVLHAVGGACYRGSRPQSAVLAATLFLHRALGTWRRRIDAFIALSRFSREKLIAGGLPAEKITVIPNFVDVETAPHSETPGKYFLYLGRLSKEKGPMTLLKGYETYAGAGNAMPLKIAGDGPLRETLLNFLREHPGLPVEYRGTVSGTEKDDLLKGAAALVFPSECYENCPYAVLESLAAGTPVLASRLGGTRELIAEGESGNLIEPGRPDLLAMALGDFARGEGRARMRGPARARALALYDSRKGLSGTQDLYLQVVNGNKL